MKNKKYLIFTAIFCVMFAVIVSAATVSYVKTIEVTSGINLSIDGEEFIPKDAYGNQVEVFNYSGSIYVPVRAISQAFGKTISYDENTMTAIITSPGASETQSSNLVSQDTVTSYVNMMHLLNSLELIFNTLDTVENAFSSASLSLSRNNLTEYSEYIDIATEISEYSKNIEETLDEYKTQFIDTNVFCTYTFDVFKYFCIRAMYNLNQGGDCLMDAALNYGLGNSESEEYYFDMYHNYMKKYRELKSEIISYLSTHHKAFRETVINEDYSVLMYSYYFVTMDTDNKCRDMEKEYDKYKNLSVEEVAIVTGDYLG